jgi:hypothetical protein
MVDQEEEMMAVILFTSPSDECHKITNQLPVYRLLP